MSSPLPNNIYKTVLVLAYLWLTSAVILLLIRKYFNIEHFINTLFRYDLMIGAIIALFLGLIRTYYSLKRFRKDPHKDYLHNIPTGPHDPKKLILTYNVINDIWLNFLLIFAPLYFLLFVVNKI